MNRQALISKVNHRLGGATPSQAKSDAEHTASPLLEADHLDGLLADIDAMIA